MKHTKAQHVQNSLAAVFARWVQSYNCLDAPGVPNGFSNGELQAMSLIALDVMLIDLV